MPNSIKIARIFGIDIKIHYSWIIVFLLVVLSLSEFFPTLHKEWSQLIVWILSIITAILLFISVLIHELCHSIVGNAQGISIRSISLFIFGGVAQLTEEPKKPMVELIMAIAGPLASIILAGLFYLLSFINQIYVHEVFIYLSLINALLAGFNLIPAFPLDGGRIFRSILWKISNNLIKATKISLIISKFFAYLLALWGIFDIFNDLTIPGIWRILIAWFLIQAAELSYERVMIQDTLSGILLEQLMDQHAVTVLPTLQINELVDNYFLHFHQGIFPVVSSSGEFLGMISVQDVKKIPKDNWEKYSVAEMMKTEINTAKRSDTAYDAIALLSLDNQNAIAIIENKKFLGMVSKNALGLVL